MKSKDLYRLSLTTYKENGYFAHLVFLFSAILMSGLILLGLVSPLFLIFVIPALVYPLLFAAMHYVSSLKEEDTISFVGFFKSFGKFFSARYSATFRVFKSALLSFVIYLVFSIIYMVTLNLFLYNCNHDGYQAIYSEIVKLSGGGINMDTVNYLMNEYPHFFTTLIIYNYVPPILVFSFMMVFYTSVNSISLFYRKQFDNIDPRVAKYIQQNVISNNRKMFYSFFLNLNWPMFILFLGGFFLGSYFGYVYFFNYLPTFVFGLVVAILLSIGVYGPFLTANMKVIYILMSDRYLIEEEKVKQEFTKSIEQMMMKMMEDNKNEEEKNSE